MTDLGAVVDNGSDGVFANVRMLHGSSVSAPRQGRVASSREGYFD